MSDIQQVVTLAKQAGDAIMAVYARDFAVYDKSDNSPLTEADMLSHNLIIKGLKSFSDLPVLSEESTDEEKKDRLNWNEYWLIDPLDGTKEFIKKNGEFTVNIALIKNHQAVLGVVYAPALKVCYWGEEDQGAWKQAGSNQPEPISVRPAPETAKGWRVVGSRSHQSEEFKEFVKALNEPEIVAMGSSLKLCLVAEGAADLYPRLGPTSEWDTAAAHAVVTAAGGQVLEHNSLEPLEYNKKPDTLLNPFFIVCPCVSSTWNPS